MSFFDRRRPRVYAHRGGCALGPENTIAAFEVGLSTGADGLELDVHLAADGTPVVIHDDTLDRTTNATGRVNALTADELARVDAGCRFVDGSGGRPFAGLGIGVPTLLAALRRFNNVPVIIELKVNTEECGRRVAEVVRTADAVDRVCLAGSGWYSARGARAALPGAAASACRPEVRMAMHRSWVGWPVRRVGYGGYQVPERSGVWHVATRRFIHHAHAAGLVVEVWTVDEPADMERLLGWGADGLISNRPDLAVAARNRVSRG